MSQHFLIFDKERSFDEKVLRTPQEVRNFIRELSLKHFTVIEFDPEDNNRTADFLPPDEAEDEGYRDFDRACSAADRRYQIEKELV